MPAISVMRLLPPETPEEQRDALVRYFCEHPGSDVFVERAVRELKRRIPVGGVYLEYTEHCCSEHLYVTWDAPDPIDAHSAHEFQTQFLRDWWIPNSDPDHHVGFLVNFI